MMNRKHILITALFILSLPLAGNAAVRKGKPQRDTVKYSDAYLDTVQVVHALELNDYSLVGFEYGAGWSNQLFNPSYKQTWQFNTGYYGVTWTKYGKLFGFMPYFGIQLGLFHGYEGYTMEENKETGTISTILGATKVTYEVYEVPLLSQFHFDTDHFKLMGGVGPYAGYRVNIHREGNWVDDGITDSFVPTDRRFDYGLKGGVGFGIVFDPVEVHFKASVRYSWANLYDPDYRSAYYYSYAYPLDIMASVGVYLQLGKRSGKTKAMLKREAREIVFGPSDTE